MLSVLHKVLHVYRLNFNMTENINAIRKGKESKLSVSGNEEKDINIILENKRLNHKKNVKAQMKQKNKFQKDIKKISISNMTLRYNKKMYEYQIQQLNKIFKQSENCPILTQDELKMLFVKYQSDGHYRANNILPSFTSISNNSCNIVETKQLSDQVQYVPTFNTKEINTKTLDTFATPYFYIDKEHLRVSGSTTTMKNKIKNKCLSVDQNPINSNNNNQLFTTHGIQVNNINVLNDIQNLNQSRLDLNAKNMFDRGDHVSHNIMYTQDIAKEHYDCGHTDKNSLYNIFDSDLQYKISNNSESSQQHDVHNIIQYDFQPNSDLWNDTYLNKWNTNKSNNQYYKNAHLTVTPHTNDLKSCCNINNSMTSQMTSIKNHLINASDFNPFIHINTYPVINSEKNVMNDFNNNTTTQENLNLPFADSNMVSDNLFAESNVCAYVNVVDQLM